MCGKSNAEAMKGEEPKLTKLAPHWSLADVARHAVDFWLPTEDVPKPDNRVKNRSTRRQASEAVAVTAARQDGSEQPQDREHEADQAEHPVPFAEGEDAQR